MKKTLSRITLFSAMAPATLLNAHDQGYSTKPWIHQSELRTQDEFQVSQTAANPATSGVATRAESQSTKPWLLPGELRRVFADQMGAAFASTTTGSSSTKPWLRQNETERPQRSQVFEIAPLK